MVTAVEAAVERGVESAVDRSVVAMVDEGVVAVVDRAVGPVSGAPGRVLAAIGQLGALARYLRALVGHLIALARPGHAVKNLLAVPLALVDVPRWTGAALLRTGWAVLAFSVAASLIYVLNDIADRRLDRTHPVKRHRPIAAGRITVPVAGLFAAGLAGLLTTMVIAGPDLPWWPLFGYLGLSVAYSRWWKHLPLLDICVIAAGFVLRVLQGYAASGAAPSGLLLTAVFSGCLILILGKRRHELTVAGVTHRPALAGYNILLADHLIGLNAALTSTTFLLYLNTDAPLGAWRPVTLAVVVPLGLLAAFRYLQTVLVREAGGDPIRALLQDRMIVAIAVLIGTTLTVAEIGARYPNLLNWMDT
ncbi:UbiA prenyltransferase family protein [Plantactinospora soyae]|uniref:4-hydroxybenzoate polyprenyltransferase n=1 Tax=Plantactinospora soyae TaxID=1544732 RepID=A0A927R1J7_9ACTN|nr:UbiA prenyltransferase family protein [Plantactinospora soyae]MBE1489793.1 4-hydroxybenzoate polyprenyltransferase [Plantactinospora soyae]